MLSTRKFQKLFAVLVILRTCCCEISQNLFHSPKELFRAEITAASNSKNDKLVSNDFPPFQFIKASNIRLVLHPIYDEDSTSNQASVNIIMHIIRNFLLQNLKSDVLGVNGVYDVSVALSNVNGSLSILADKYEDAPDRFFASRNNERRDTRKYFATSNVKNKRNRQINQHSDMNKHNNLEGEMKSISFACTIYMILSSSMPTPTKNNLDNLIDSCFADHKNIFVDALTSSGEESLLYVDQVDLYRDDMNSDRNATISQIKNDTIHLSNNTITKIFSDETQIFDVDSNATFENSSTRMNDLIINSNVTNSTDFTDSRIATTSLSGKGDVDDSLQNSNTDEGAAGINEISKLEGSTQNEGIELISFILVMLVIIVASTCIQVTIKKRLRLCSKRGVSEEDTMLEISHENQDNVHPSLRCVTSRPHLLQLDKNDESVESKTCLEVAQRSDEVVPSIPDKQIGLSDELSWFLEDFPSVTSYNETKGKLRWTELMRGRVVSSSNVLSSSSSGVLRVDTPCTNDSSTFTVRDLVASSSTSSKEKNMQIDRIDYKQWLPFNGANMFTCSADSGGCLIDTGISGTNSVMSLNENHENLLLQKKELEGSRMSFKYQC